MLLLELPCLTDARVVQKEMFVSMDLKYSAVEFKIHTVPDIFNVNRGKATFTPKEKENDPYDDTDDGRYIFDVTI